MKLEGTEPFNTDNASILGFEYNYFEGYTYQHKAGFHFHVYNVNEVFYKGEAYKVFTVNDFLNLRNKLRK